MRLKRVRVFGFKTFADRADFDIDGGLVAVVGPNGCGKSNLVDAILWGLGEGTPRQLRAASSQDVIFNGSTKRKPVAFAEVSLLFDNEDGSLPVDTPEVVVTRRMSRSGESEYRINRTVCRQRDVYELLADTGLGRTGYAIVGQKEIDQALSASAEDRRAWVDEAAGVQRYRARKQDALKRLAAAQQHLQRVSDLLRELESQREPLREEAELARSYKSASDALRSIEVGMLAKEVAAAVSDIAQQTEKIEASHRSASEEEKLADRSEKSAQEVSGRAASVEREIEALWSAQQRGLTAQERAESDLRLAEQRLEGLANLERTLGDEAGSLESRLFESKAELESLVVEESRERDALAAIHSALGTVGQEAASASDAVRSIETKLSEARAMQSKQLRLDLEQVQRLERIRQVRREIAGIESALPALKKAAAEAQAAFVAANSVAEDSRGESRKLEAESLALRQEADADGEVTRLLLAEQAVLEGRKRGIEATLQTHDGMTQGSKSVLDAAGRGELPAQYLPVADAISVEKELALAIETALGQAGNDLIVETETDAETAIEWLKEHRAGRATFHPLSLLRDDRVGEDISKLLANEVVVGRASDLVQCSDRVKPVVKALLGRVLIVRSLQGALQIAKTRGWSRMVSLEGEVLHSTGAVTGGRHAKGGYGIVQRKADLADISKEIVRLDRELARLHDLAEKRQLARNAVESKIGRLREQDAAQGSEIEEARVYRDALRDEEQTTLRSLDRAIRDVESLSGVAGEKLEVPDVGLIEAERDHALRLLAEMSSRAEQADETLRAAETRLNQAATRRETCQKRVESALHDETHRRMRIEGMEPERARIQADIGHCREAAAKAKEERQRADQGLEALKLKRQQLLEQALRLGEEARHARSHAAAIVQAAHQAELARARAESKRATSLERLAEEYGLLQEDALNRAQSEELPSDAAALVSRLRREIRAMGDVNVGAIEAFDRLSDRCDELTAQRADIEGGVAEVRSTISELDKLTSERFLNTFESVRLAFAELFTKLFAGGEAQLKLTMPESVLESGIEIDVTLPGKKRQRLELLSGGERALCACAFLFALLRVKPSPLVVLDEVDAPLDGRNVERFVKLLEEFQAVTQFIVVTHNPTTIEAAPVWLGVTMQEPGVSTLVPSRVPPKMIEAKPVYAVVALPDAEPVPA